MKNLPGVPVERTTMRCLRKSLYIAIAILTFPLLSPAQNPDLMLWYKKPAPVWTEALPIGNGRIGAMVFGGANTGTNNGDQESARTNRDIADGKQTRGQDEHLQLNESTVWQGDRSDKPNPKAHDGFLQVRRLLLESKGLDGAKIAEAERIAADTMLPTPRGLPGYSTLGDLYVRMAGDEQLSDYRRELNLESGLAAVSYISGGVQYHREAFASAPDRIIVLRLTADKPGKLSFTVIMDRRSDFQAHTLSDRDLAITQGPAHKDQISFQAQVRVLLSGGTIERNDASLSISNANGEATPHRRRHRLPWRVSCRPMPKHSRRGFQKILRHAA